MEKRKKFDEDNKVAPTVNEEESYGVHATEEDVEKGESTRVVRLRNEYPSGE